MPIAAQGAPPIARTAARSARWFSIAFMWLLAAAGHAADIDLPKANLSDPISIHAQSAQRWIQGEYDVLVLQGECRIKQGETSSQSNEAVVWIDRAEPGEQRPHHLIVYLEGQVVLERPSGGQTARVTSDRELQRFDTAAAITINVPQITGAPDATPPLYQRGMALRMPEASRAIQRTQYTQVTSDPSLVPVGPLVPATRRFTIYPRSNVPNHGSLRRDKATGQSVMVFQNGWNLIIEGATKTGGTLDISADRIVIWSIGLDQLEAANGQIQAENVPLEIYIEGDIVFREDQRVIYADRMYYDVRAKTGTVLNAEMLTPVPSYQGKLRLKTDLLQQVGEGQFYAKNSFITSSRFGRPGYRMQMSDIFYEDRSPPTIDPMTGLPTQDPYTGGSSNGQDKWVTGRNSFLFLGEVPIFYWPTFSTSLEDPTLYIRRARLKNDNVFGTQILTNWDMYQLLGIKNRPSGDTDWDASLDYLSDRGLGHGTTYTYQRDGFFMFPGRTAGLADYWGIQDHGHDNLGRGQRDLVPEKKYRYRLFWQHRQMLPYDWRLSSELGWISDRNFLEQYFDHEWNELKDESTGFELKRGHDNITYSITADTRVNGFFTQTEWYPRADHYWLGQSLFGDVLTWYEHSSIGYGRYRVLSYPEDQAQRDTFRYLPWEKTSKGERLVTTQEIDWPFQIGPVKTVPYAMGQLAHWGEDLNGEDLQRAYWQAGIRTSMPMWRVDPSVESALWNVHGLAHKIVFDAEFSVAEANRDLDLLPLYDPLDDDSIEAFRRRMAAVTYGTQLFPGDPIPYRFDPRSYAIRSGLAGWVTSPSAEVVDDLMAMRMGMRHRWQTKRGMPGQRKIIDWVVLDTNATWFPKENRDNFGKSVGLVDYDFRWHVGDRLTLVSDGIFDFFDQGQQIVTIGGFLSRPPRGNFYMGLRLLEGPIDSKILSISYNYWMSPKWVSSFGTSFDLGKNGNIGQRLTITRIGESLLVSAGFNVDASQGNVGVMMAVEPRFLPKTRLGQAGGVRIPVAGAYGLE